MLPVRDWVVWPSQAVIRGERWKYVQFGSDTLPPILFDMLADPGESTNLAADPKYSEQVVEHVIGASCPGASFHASFLTKVNLSMEKI